MANQICDTIRNIVEEVNKIPELVVVGKPEVMISRYLRSRWLALPVETGR
jgi:hypothetical protein